MSRNTDNASSPDSSPSGWDQEVLYSFDGADQVTNAGGTSATQMRGSFYLSVHFAFKGGTFPGSGGTCNETLVAGEICDVVVTFTPQYVGQFEQPLSVLFFDGVANQKATGSYLRGHGI